MDINAVQQLAELMEKYDLAEVQLSEGDSCIALSRAAAFATAVAPAMMAAAPAPAPAAAASASPADALGGDSASAPGRGPGEELTAPLVGVAYRAAEPGAAPFVEVGQAVKKGQVLCIIEAMKVMNEFTAPRAGTVGEICFENEGLVEFGQCLFRLL